jgi:hypothetical protein
MKKTEMDGSVVCIEVGIAYKRLVRKPDGMRPLWKAGKDRMIILKWILKEILFASVVGFNQAQDRVQWWVTINMVVNLWFPQKLMISFD